MEGGVQLIQRLNRLLPVLNHVGRKGDNGRVAVVGGSFQFTGAPYYSAISSLKIGGDLAHIFCSKFSGIPIKSYSPEVIVHPVFISSEEQTYTPIQLKQTHEFWQQKISSWKGAINAWVIGPGLGRDKYMHDFFPLLLQCIPSHSVVIFDADAIHYLCKHPYLFQEIGRFKSIITPNHKELTALLPYLNGFDFNKIVGETKTKDEVEQFVSSYVNPNFTLLIKGEHDFILGKKSFVVRLTGGIKRCGGIGDILAGVTAVCSYWDFDYGPALASRIVKIASAYAFEKQGRGLTAPAIILELSRVVKELDRGSLRDQKGQPKL